jgi:hypothetical protein
MQQHSAVQPQLRKRLEPAEALNYLTMSGMNCAKRIRLCQIDVLRNRRRFAKRRPALFVHTGIRQLGENTDTTPHHAPFHPGAEKWCREHEFKV